MWEEGEYYISRRIGHPLGFLGHSDGAFDLGREVLDKHAAYSRWDHCCDPSYSQRCFSPGGLLGHPHPTSFSACLFSWVLRLLRA